MIEVDFKFLVSQTNRLPYHVANHTHPCYEIVYYASGTGVTTLHNRKYAYKENSFTVIPSDCPHDEVALTETEVIYIGFEYDEKLQRLPVSLYEDTEDQAIYRLLLEARKEMSTKPMFYDYRLNLITQELVVTILRMTGAKAMQRSEEQDPISYIVNYMNSNFRNKIDFELLSDSIGYSYHRFRHLFKEHTGVPPKQYMLQRRIDYAKQLLLNSDLTINAISHEVGFSSTSQFILAFKKMLNTTPEQYRKSDMLYPEVSRYFNE